jgi:uncharacterized protein YjiS (DUF1127 family)
MKATFSTSEAGQPIAAPRLPGALGRTLQLWRSALGAALALRRPYRRKAEISALSDFELKDLGLHRPDINA